MVNNTGPDSDDMKVEAKPQGPECPKCGDRFPSDETLQAHLEHDHDAAS
jgi:hypothetical protein